MTFDLEGLTVHVDDYGDEAYVYCEEVPECSGHGEDEADARHRLQLELGRLYAHLVGAGTLGPEGCRLRDLLAARSRP